MQPHCTSLLFNPDAATHTQMLQPCSDLVQPLRLAAGSPHLLQSL